MFWSSRKPYRVKIGGLMSRITYEEGGRRMHIDGEKIGGEVGMIVYTSTMVWRPPHESELVTDEARERIKRNITEARPNFRFEWV